MANTTYFYIKATRLHIKPLKCKPELSKLFINSWETITVEADVFVASIMCAFYKYEQFLSTKDKWKVTLIKKMLNCSG